MARFLRVLVIVLLSLSTAMTLLGGIGTTCVAFFAERFSARMAVLVPVKPIFQLLVVISIGAGIYGIVATTRLSKSRPKAYYQALLFLLIGGIASGVQYYYSLTLRGSTAPNNVRLYLTVLTLAVMLLLRLPGLWSKLGFNQPGAAGETGHPAGGIALFLCGLVVMTTPLWAAATHVINGTNTANELFWLLLIAGAGMSLMGGARLVSLSPQTRAARGFSRPAGQ